MSSIVERVSRLAIEIQQIPAPTFQEFKRGKFVSELFRKEGLANVEIDPIGNVFGLIRGSEPENHLPVIVSAHMDTVFPIDTPLDVKVDEHKISGPGIGDNSVSVASLIGLIWMLRESPHKVPSDIWLVANVGEEGLGNLLGMRAVVERFGAQVAAYLVVEGTALGNIHHRALRVQRYRIKFKTNGGHSWAHFGNPSAIHEAATFITKLSGLEIPQDPRTTYNVGIIRGGTSINTIAANAELELDLRSESENTLSHIFEQVEEIIKGMRTDEVRIKVKEIGSRPGGEIPADHPLVQQAIESLDSLGLSPRLKIGSTDANIPLSQGLPSVCIGITLGGHVHTTEEFILTKPLKIGLEHLSDMVRRISTQQLK